MGGLGLGGGQQLTWIPSTLPQHDQPACRDVDLHKGLSWHRFGLPISSCWSLPQGMGINVSTLQRELQQPKIPCESYASTATLPHRLNRAA